MEPTPNTYFHLFLGYSAIWTLVVCFVLMLMREQKQLKSQLCLLREEVSRLQKSDRPSSVGSER